ncbi:SPOR domain-containing protein [Roseateles sp.]|uniref:SPOR domain-containing protein n=1 Tax=Roseateles sp. TaxID=1971397 RepID=UPI00392CA03C
MGLFSFLRPSTEPTPSKRRNGRAGGATETDDVQQLRLRAKRRLIGAALLVLVGVVVFPLVFETQPRPIPVDLPISIPRKDTVATLVVPAPAALASEPAATAPIEPAVEPASSAKAGEKATDKLSDKSPEKSPDKSPEKAADKAADKAAAKPTEKAAPKPAAKAAEADAARIQALLDGKDAPRKAEAAPGGQRFIVQVGAFSDAKAAQEMRHKVEKLGLKTYAQSVETPDGTRVRVRVGTFASRDDAAKAAAKLHAAGLAGTVLTL